MSGRNAKQTRRHERVAAHSSSLDPMRQGGRARVLVAVGAVVVAVVVVGGYFAARDNGPASATSVGSRSSRALELSGTDPVTGGRVDLARYAGKPVVLNVWGSWCTGCNDEAADLARFARTHPDVQVVGIDTEDTTSGARSFYRKWGWRHPSIADPHGVLAARLGIQGTPTTFFLNSRHEPVTQIVGATDEAGFDRGLAAATSSAP